MADNTTFIHINDNGEEHHSKYDRWPVVMMGDFGGRLRAGGRRVLYPDPTRFSDHRSLNQFWATVAYGMGIENPQFALDPTLAKNRPGVLDELVA
ncbi:MAG: hypothetical protein AAFQ82_03265 [Myxococcota bacterium]